MRSPVVESWKVWTTPIRHKWNRPKSSQKNWRRDFDCSSPIKIGWTTVGWSDGVLFGFTEVIIYEEMKGKKLLSKGDTTHHSVCPVPFGSEIFYHPFSIKEKNRLHQLSKKVVNSIFIGHALNAGGGGRLDGRAARGKCRRIEEQQCFRSPRHSYFHVLTVQWNEQIMVRIIIPPTLVGIGFTGFTWWYLARGMVENAPTLSTTSKAATEHRQANPKADAARRLTDICYTSLDDERIWHRDQKMQEENWKCIWNPPCAKQKENPLKSECYVNQRGETVCRSTAGENLTHPKSKVKYRCLCSQNWCSWISMPYQRKRQTKARRAYCSPRIQFNESLQVGSFADTFSKRDEKSGRKSGSGQGMG